jgi:hypothetical protein
MSDMIGSSGNLPHRIAAYCLNARRLAGRARPAECELSTCPPGKIYAPLKPFQFGFKCSRRRLDPFGRPRFREKRVRRGISLFSAEQGTLIPCSAEKIPCSLV